MTKEQRDKIITLCRKNYEALGCVFPSEDTHELVEYLYESEHGDEVRSIHLAVTAHNLYNDDNMTVNDFYEWHGM